MQGFPDTRHSLLVRVQQNDRDAWDEFGNIYRPVIYRIARRRGWQDADAQDVAQKILLKVATAIPSFRPDASRAKFRTWLTTVCHNTLVDELRKVRPDAAKGGADAFEEADHQAIDVDLTQEELSCEHRRQVFRWAAAQASEAFSQSTWEAFWQTAVQNMPVSRVAQEMNLSVGAIYTARSRVMQFLKEKVREYDDAEM